MCASPVFAYHACIERFVRAVVVHELESPHGLIHIAPNLCVAPPDPVRAVDRVPRKRTEHRLCVPLPSVEVEHLVLHSPLVAAASEAGGESRRVRSGFDEARERRRTLRQATSEAGRTNSLSMWAIHAGSSAIKCNQVQPRATTCNQVQPSAIQRTTHYTGT